MTKGRKQFLVSVMAYDSMTVAWKPSILGYMSIGEIVPEVMTTLLNLSNTGAMAREASRQLEIGPASTCQPTRHKDTGLINDH